jgi:hypothetical protein
MSGPEKGALAMREFLAGGGIRIGRALAAAAMVGTGLAVLVSPSIARAVVPIPSCGDPNVFGVTATVTCNYTGD